MSRNSSNDAREGMIGKLLHLIARVPHAYLALGQGVYYFLGGAWPLLSVTTFQSVTGPKTDVWLVKTVSLLLLVIGITLIVAGIRWRVTLEIFLLAVGSAAALAAIELVYVLAGRISPVYLLDLVVELIFISWWASVYIRGFSNPEVCSLFDPTFSSSGPGERE